MPVVDNTASVHPKADIGENVEIGPYSVIGENIKIGATILLAAGDYFDMTLQNSSGGDQLVLGGIYRMFGMFRVA